MAEKIEIRVKKSDIKQPQKDVTTISHPPLVHGFVVEPVETWQLFAMLAGPVRSEAIEIDAEGRVVIRDAKFAAAVKKILDKVELEGEEEAAATNIGACGNVKCLDEALQ
jgi:hypothetical protein